MNREASTSAHHTLDWYLDQLGPSPDELARGLSFPPPLRDFAGQNDPVNRFDGKMVREGGRPLAMFHLPEWYLENLSVSSGPKHKGEIVAGRNGKFWLPTEAEIQEAAWSLPWVAEWLKERDRRAQRAMRKKWARYRAGK